MTSKIAQKPPLQASEVKTLEDLRDFLYNTPVKDHVPLNKVKPFKVPVSKEGCSKEVIHQYLGRIAKKLNTQG
jgi:hypothetical protein